MLKGIVIVCLTATMCLGRVPFFFTLDLHLVENGQLKNEAGIAWQLDQAKESGAEGVIADIWWGIAEPEPRDYRFNPYIKLAELCRDRGLEIQFTLSFHGCGKDDWECKMELPGWISRTENIWPKTFTGREVREYVSIFYDNTPVLQGRTPLQAYNDFFNAFATAFFHLMGSTVKQVQIGLGPSGQLRYPSYVYSDFCGVGEFVFAEDKGQKAWEAHLNSINGQSWPAAVLNFRSNQSPWDSRFFRNDADSKHNGFLSQYGKALSEWYSRILLDHGKAVLTLARAALPNLGLGAKLSAVHWTAGSSNRAPEVTTGYLVTDSFNFYAKFMNICKDKSIVAVFSGFEMINNLQSENCFSRGWDLVTELKSIASLEEVELMGENAWQRTDQAAFDTIALQAANIKSFNFLRLSNFAHGDWDTKNRFQGLISRLADTDSAAYSYPVGAERRSFDFSTSCKQCKRGLLHKH